jgi:hypothetical protein
MVSIGWRVVHAEWGRHRIPYVPAAGRLPPAPLGQMGWWVPVIFAGQWFPHYWHWETELPGELGDVARTTRLAMTAASIQAAKETGG